MTNPSHVYLVTFPERGTHIIAEKVQLRDDGTAVFFRNDKLHLAARGWLMIERQMEAMEKENSNA